MSLSDKEKIAHLRLIRTENVGPITFQKMIDRFGSASNALDALPELAKRGGKTLVAAPLKDTELELNKIEKSGAKLLFKGTPDYPRYLAEVEDAPPVLTVLGHPSLLSKPSLGVVGARNASLMGRKIAESFSAKVSEAGYIITSGLARGIDTAAHMASIGKGTVAVVAGGIDVIYPPENDKLYRDIAERGCIVAESPFGTEPIARHFPRRNRIISGLSLGVLVVEAASRSGSLITERMALEQNREVFAVPGSPMDPRAEGTNSLIKDGAHLATAADDILQVLRSMKFDSLRDAPAPPWKGATTPLAQRSAEPSPDLRAKILENLSPVPVAVDELIRAVDASVTDVLTVILELELAGHIERHPGNKLNLV